MCNTERVAGGPTGGFILLHNRKNREQSLCCRSLMFAGHCILVFLAGGCALQATAVDLEFDLQTLQKHNRELQQRLEGVEKASRERVANTDQIELLSKVEGLASDLQTLSGNIEENSHLVATLSIRFDDIAIRVEEGLSRLGALEARISTLERTSSARRKEPQRETLVLPGRSLDGTPRRESAGTTPNEAYNLAYNDYLKGHYDLAIMGFQNFLQLFSTSTLVPHALYWTGEAHYGKKEYAKAIEWYDRVLGEYPRSEKAANSLLKKGYTYQELGDKPRARKMFKQVVEQYPFTKEADLSKNRLADLR